MEFSLRTTTVPGLAANSFRGKKRSNLDIQRDRGSKNILELHFDSIREKGRGKEVFLSAKNLLFLSISLFLCAKKSRQKDQQRVHTCFFFWEKIVMWRERGGAEREGRVVVVAQRQFPLSESIGTAISL